MNNEENNLDLADSNRTKQYLSPGPGFGHDDYDIMFASQDRSCAVCNAHQFQLQRNA